MRRQRRLKSGGMDHLIWHIEPQESPLIAMTHRQARIKMQPKGQQSMKARRRRVAKPLKFTPRDSLRKVFEWTREPLTPGWSSFRGLKPINGQRIVGAVEVFESPWPPA